MHTRRCGILSEPELPEPIKRIEVYLNDKREPVQDIKDATSKYVTLFDDNGEVTEQYSIIIVNGIDPELEEEETEEVQK